jgi:hypothetical protein
MGVFGINTGAARLADKVDGVLSAFVLVLVDAATEVDLQDD